MANRAPTLLSLFFPHISLALLTTLILNWIKSSGRVAARAGECMLMRSSKLERLGDQWTDPEELVSEMWICIWETHRWSSIFKIVLSTRASCMQGGIPPFSQQELLQLFTFWVHPVIILLVKKKQHFCSGILAKHTHSYSQLKGYSHAAAQGMSFRSSWQDLWSRVWCLSLDKLSSSRYVSRQGCWQTSFLSPSSSSDSVYPTGSDFWDYFYSPFSKQLPIETARVFYIAQI